MSKKICVLISVITTFVITTALILGLLVFVTPFGDFLAVRSIIMAGFVREVDSDDLDNAALYGMVEELDDPYSQYLSDEEYAMFIESLNSEYQGIGVEIYIDAEDNLDCICQFFCSLVKSLDCINEVFCAEFNANFNAVEVVFSVNNDLIVCCITLFDENCFNL